MINLALCLIVAFIFSPVGNAISPKVPLESRDSPIKFFDWKSIRPSRQLKYVNCYGKFKCARLQVPLDWNATKSTLYDKLATLAIIKLPAKVPVSDPSYGGPLFTNPGGPGGSGVLLVVYNGRMLQNIVDDKKHFDIVSWDPRGIYESTPSASCFETPKDRDEWNALLYDEGQLDEGERVLDMKWARAHALGKQCAKKEFGKYVSTAFTARDMIEMADKIQEARSLEQSNSGRDIAESDENRKPPKVQYLGFSYGTMLGNTFASLFPDRVGRFVLDGVVNAPDYVAQAWKKNLQETETVLRRCYKYCFDAGPIRCPIFNSGGPGAIAKDVENLLETLKHNPVGIATNTGTPSIITYADVKYYLFESLYDPTTSFVQLSHRLAEMMKGNFRTFSTEAGFLLEVFCPVHGSFPTPETNEAVSAIACGDGDVQNMDTKAQFKQYLHVLESQSRTAGPLWAEWIRLQCTGWQVRPRWRFTGPFTGRTATPILWLGNTADPVTPSYNTLNMAKLHPGSATLLQDSEGHTALFSAPSNCTLNVVKQYFNSVKLPKPGTKCPAAYHPFQKSKKTMLDSVDDQDETPLKRPSRLYRLPLGRR